MNIEFDDPDAHVDDEKEVKEREVNKYRAVLVHNNPWPVKVTPTIEDEIECERKFDFRTSEGSGTHRMMLGFFQQRCDPNHQVGNKNGRALTIDGQLRMEIPLPASALHVHRDFYLFRDPVQNLTDVARLLKAWWFRCKEIYNFDCRTDTSAQYRLAVAVSESIHNNIWRKTDYKSDNSDTTIQWMFQRILTILSADLLNYNCWEAVSNGIITFSDKRIPPAQLLIYLGMKSRIVKNHLRFQSLWNCFKNKQFPNERNVGDVVEQVKKWRMEEDTWNVANETFDGFLNTRIYDSDLAARIIGSFHYIEKVSSLKEPIILSPEEFRTLPRQGIHCDYFCHLRHSAGFNYDFDSCKLDDHQILMFWNVMLGRFGYRIRLNEELEQYEITETLLMQAAKPWIANYDRVESIVRVFAPNPIPRYLLSSDRQFLNLVTDINRMLFHPFHNDVVLDEQQWPLQTIVIDL